VTIRGLGGRVRDLEQAASRRNGVRVLVRSVDLDGEALAAWEAEYLDVPHDAALTVIVRHFGIHTMAPNA